MVKINFKKSYLKKSPVYKDPTEILMDFTKVLSDAGMIISGLPDTSGKINRLSTTTDKGRERSGWYVAFDGEVFGAAYGNFKTGEQGKWSSVERHSMTAAQIAEHQRQVNLAKEQREVEQNEIYKQSAKKALSIIAGARKEDQHGYLEKKKIEGAATVHAGCIAIPAIDADGEISTIQFISEHGDKKFLAGGKKAGCFHLINGDSETVYVCEGWATGKTINEATGNAVAVAFDSGNLMPATETVRAKFPNSSLIIAGDDDHEKDVNVGRSKAEACAQALGLMCVFPDVDAGETDFNDVGVERTQKSLNEKPEAFEEKQSLDNMPPHLLNPDGILADIVNYYNSTARAPQHGFAVQVSLAVASLLLGRRFKTTKNNFSSMYFLNVAKSGTGKEHIKTVCENVLDACGKEDLLNGSGYTSAGAVFSTLLRRPRHLTIIDEFGRYLEAAGTKGNSNFQEANTQIMEAVGRTAGVMRPLAYSTMAVSSEKADEMANRKIYNPAITLVSMTTPSTLFANISNSNVSDGFIGRFIVSVSDMPRCVHRHTDFVDVPKRIVDWSEKIDARFGVYSDSELAEDRPSFIELSFDHQSMVLIAEFDQERVDTCDELELFGLEALAGRSSEMAMKMALIVALAKDPNANTVDAASTSWAIQYVRHSLQSTIKIMKRNISNSDVEKEKKEILNALRELGESGITWSDMMKQSPFSKYGRKNLEEILRTLEAAELATLKEDKTGRGRPKQVWYAI